MPTIAVERAEDIVTGWRSGLALLDAPENPAGALYQAGDYAEADITMTGAPWYTPLHCSRTYDCTRTESDICRP